MNKGPLREKCVTPRTVFQSKAKIITRFFSIFVILYVYTIPSSKARKMLTIKLKKVNDNFTPLSTAKAVILILFIHCCGFL